MQARRSRSSTLTCRRDDWRRLRSQSSSMLRGRRLKRGKILSIQICAVRTLNLRHALEKLLETSHLERFPRDKAKIIEEYRKIMKIPREIGRNFENFGRISKTSETLENRSQIALMKALVSHFLLL